MLSILFSSFHHVFIIEVYLKYFMDILLYVTLLLQEALLLQLVSSGVRHLVEERVKEPP